MKKVLLFFALLIFSGLPGVISAQEQLATNQVDLVFFYGQGCPHCANMSLFLDDLQEKYPELNVIDKEVYFDSDNQVLYTEMSELYDYYDGGVPLVFFDDQVVSGFGASLTGPLEQGIVNCINEGCESPLEILEAANGEDDSKPSTLSTDNSSPEINPQKTRLVDQLTIPAVLSAAAVDAINPCAFAVLIILLTTILASKSRKKALWSGLAFSASIFISYLLMGVGLYSAIAVSGLTRSFYIVVSILAIIIGLFNLKDYLWYGKWFVMEVPMSWRPKLKTILRGVTSAPGAFLIGFVISLFLLPCTSGPYIVILGLLAETTTRNTALGYLILYNFIFILPMMIITFVIYFGLTTTEKAESWRKRQLKVLHLIAGIIILLLGIGMLASIALGWM